MVQLLCIGILWPIDAFSSEGSCIISFHPGRWLNGRTVGIAPLRHGQRKSRAKKIGIVNLRVKRSWTENNKILVVRDGAAAGTAARSVCNSREKVLQFARHGVLWGQHFFRCQLWGVARKNMGSSARLSSCKVTGHPLVSTKISRS